MDREIPPPPPKRGTSLPAVPPPPCPQHAAIPWNRKPPIQETCGSNETSHHSQSMMAPAPLAEQNGSHSVQADGQEDVSDDEKKNQPVQEANPESQGMETSQMPETTEENPPGN
ncbi:unnamed protein product [Menidia menidia]|uniref:(Atlantic silverside) hypothetical protein n=1 Tax=Menidia menidia TaxID=238744 RepID=A0A8S4BEM0_9TELE|nr:unnamed protein product [Menidia menidia]CAG5941822.1 unnamed protein product [Menidia menidia]